MTKDDIKGFLFSLAWCTWRNHHTENVHDSLKRFGLTDNEAKELIAEFEEIIRSPIGEGSPK